MALYSKRKKLKTAEPAESAPFAARLEALWTKCDACGQLAYTTDWERNWNVCPKCGHHDPPPVRRRLEMVLDPGSFQELDADLAPQDPLGFVDQEVPRPAPEHLQGLPPASVFAERRRIR